MFYQNKILLKFRPSLFAAIRGTLLLVQCTNALAGGTEPLESLMKTLTEQLGKINRRAGFSEPCENQVRAPVGFAAVKQVPPPGRTKHYPLGLDNFGNTCYFNSTLKLLFSREDFGPLTQPSRKLLQGLGETHENFKARQLFKDLLHSLYKILQKNPNEMTAEQIADKKNLHRSIFKLMKHLPSFKGFVAEDQNDPTEVLPKISDLLEMDRIPGNFKIRNHMTAQSGEVPGWNQVTHKEFTDNLITMVVQDRESPRKARSVNDLIQRKFQEPEIINAFMHEESGKRMNVEKLESPVVASPEKTPEYLTINLNRDIYHQGKHTYTEDPVKMNDIMIQYEQEDLKSDPIEVHYTPVAFIVYIPLKRGNDPHANQVTPYGHYVEFTYEKENHRWAIHNDDEYFPLTEDEFQERLDRYVNSGVTSVLYKKLPNRGNRGTNLLKASSPARFLAELPNAAKGSSPKKHQPIDPKIEAQFLSPPKKHPIQAKTESAPKKKSGILTRLTSWFKS